MAMYNNLSEIEARCTEIINSPYMRRELPPELMKLKLLLTKVERLTREDVPAMISEIKRLRSQNKRLEAEAEATHPSLSSDPLNPIDLDAVAHVEPEDLASVARPQPADLEAVAHLEPADLEAVAHLETEELDGAAHVESEKDDNEAIIEAVGEGGR